MMTLNKMIYLDADIQVFDNIDHLFDLPNGSFYGVVDCLCEMYGPPCPQKIRWPKELGPEPAFYFNGGMFMFEPNLNTYDELLRTLDVTPPTPFAEQDFLNMFFREVSKPLLPIYNMLVAMMWRHSEMMDLDKVKVVHYCVGGSKPWRYTGKEENMDRADIKMLVERWWDIFNDESLDFKNRGDGLGGGGGGGRRRMLAAPAVETAEAVVLYPSVSPAA
ncbi:hypothetical protein ABFS82_02G089000 [Erythranthe guttata]|uniref:Hexosyltransferase n=2 Tax=Erythranthe guttata TaxID=4155 RepID=A0A022RWC1_ERYGU|nr:hypothetical protein MIMGU_mgv1a024625mg [Erythranthe guttata]